jgi:hypothetical protein
MLCVVAPVDQRFPEAADEVNTTEPPVQKVVGPPAVIVGVAGFAFTAITVGAEVAEQPFPSVYVTEYDPAEVTLIVCVVALVDHRLPDPCEEVRFTEDPAQKVVGPLAEIVGVDGFAFTVTTVNVEVDEQPPPFV